MPNLPFPLSHPVTDIEDWNPETQDVPDTTSDKVAKVFQDAAVGAARKIVAIANGAHSYDYTEKGATSAMRLELQSCQYILESIKTGVGQEQPWQEWARQLIQDPDSIPKELANSIPPQYMGE